ncbi:MAG: hypothetical protein H6710_10425 [Myxococcales bacterium]|nr:hypothetical protein [Myxococcales bacterium]MCB9702577.1 hypothetical protein [Myxococcales bacterium]
MAREKVVDLVVRQGSVEVVRRAGERRGDAEPSRRPASDLRLWAERAPFPWQAMVGGGLAMVALGVVTAILTTWGFFGTAFLSSLLTMGGGLVFLGLYKRRALLRAAPPEPRALSASEHALLRERSRRIRTLIEEAGRPRTFEDLQAATRWTRDAVLDTLLFMKERGELSEDVDLDTGEWVYAPAEPEVVPAPPRSLMLDERRALSERTETEG